MTEPARSPAPTPGGKLLYTGKTHTTGGRENGASRSSDGRLDVRLSNSRLSADRHESGAAVRRRLVGLLRKRDGDCGPENEDRSSR